MEETVRPCMAVVLINPREPEYAASYHWCKLDEHPEGAHECYCGIFWNVAKEDLVELTPNMVAWRTAGKPEAYTYRMTA